MCKQGRLPHGWQAALLCCAVLVAASGAASIEAEPKAASKPNGAPKQAGGEQDTKESSSAPQPEYFFYNQVTGERQWEDPGDVPYEDESGNRYWLMANGEKTLEDVSLFKYAWVEQYSEDLSRPYYYNQETRESTWERPVDLAWRRVKVNAKQPS